MGVHMLEPVAVASTKPDDASSSSDTSLARAEHSKMGSQKGKSSNSTKTTLLTCAHPPPPAPWWPHRPRPGGNTSLSDSLSCL